MDKELFIKFLKYLHGRVDKVSQEDVIDKFEIDSLRRDLSKLKSELAEWECPDLDSTLVKSVMELSLSINESHLEGDKRSFWYSLLRPLLGASPVGMAIQKKNTEIIAKDLTDFRNKISHILFALEI